MSVNVIHRYDLIIGENVTTALLARAGEVVHVGVKDTGQASIWIEGPEGLQETERRFICRYTGRPWISLNTPVKHVGSFYYDAYTMCHIYEVLS